MSARCQQPAFGAEAPGTRDEPGRTGAAPQRPVSAAAPRASQLDAQAVALPSRPGLLIAGDWPQFDLGEWLALRSGDDSGLRLADWLGPVDVHLDRALVAGFELRDVVAQLRFAGNTWKIGLQGPMAEGEVTIPDDLSTGQPIVLQMQLSLIHI